MIRFEDRARFLERVVYATRDLADRSDIMKKVPATVDYFTFFKEQAVLAEPVASMPGTRGYRDHGPICPPRFCASAQPLLVFILFSSDAGLGKVWEKLLRIPAIGTYRHTPHWLLLRGDIPETTTVRAITLLHELAHAHRAWTERRSGSEGVRTPIDFLNEECEVLEFERKIWETLGHEPFTRTLDQAVMCIENKLRLQPESVESTLFPLFDSTRMLEQFLEVAPNKKACENRERDFAVMAHFEAYNRWYPDGEIAREYKRKLLQRLYRDNGLEL